MTDNANEPNVTERTTVFQAWSGGWMMGIGFGVFVMFFATELPNDFFERARFLLVGAGVISFVFGLIRIRSNNLSKTLFSKE